MPPQMVGGATFAATHAIAGTKCQLPGGLFGRTPSPYDSKEPSEAQNRPALTENLGFRFVDTRKEVGSAPAVWSRREGGSSQLSVTVPLSTTLTQFAQFARSIYRAARHKRRSVQFTPKQEEKNES